MGLYLYIGVGPVWDRCAVVHGACKSWGLNAFLRQ